MLKSDSPKEMKKSQGRGVGKVTFIDNSDVFMEISGISRPGQPPMYSLRESPVLNGISRNVHEYPARYSLV